MTLYRLRLQPRGAFATPCLADTLYGHLCWAAIRTAGDARLRDLLDAARSGAPRFVLSDGFPADLLPMPVLPPEPIPAGLEAQRKHFQAEKARKKARWLTLADFGRILRGERFTPANLSVDHKKALAQERATLKNTINRLTSTTPDAEQGGGLYEMEETFQQSPITVYAQVEATYANTLRKLLEYLAQTGYGKRKSIGYGAFRDITMESLPDNHFGSPPDANAFVSLSTFVPAQNDPTDGFWQVRVKYGKLGEELAASENPFKRPLIMLQAGAVFRLPPGQLLRPWYGRVVEAISYLPNVSVAQVALALPVGMRLP